MTSPVGKASRRQRLLILSAVVLGVFIFFGANAHLLYVAMTARSDCVAHLKLPAEDESDDRFRAARSSC